METLKILEEYGKKLDGMKKKTRINYLAEAKTFLAYLDKGKIPFDKADENTAEVYSGGNGRKKNEAMRLLKGMRPDKYEYLKTAEEKLSDGFEILLGRYVRHVSCKGVSERSICIIRSYISRFLRFLEGLGIMEILKAGKKALSDYSLHLLTYQYGRVKGRDKVPYSASSRMQILVQVRNFFRYLKENGIVLINPALEVPLPKVPRKMSRNIPDRAEVDKMLSKIDKEDRTGLRDYAIIETLYSTGMRAPEIIQLSTGDINFESGFIVIRKGKYGKPRTVPASEEAFSAILEYMNGSRPVLAEKQASPEDWLFLETRDGTNLSCQTVAMIIRKYAAKAGIKKRFVSHALRYACATDMLRNGADIRIVQEMLGHERLNTTQGYTKVVKGDLKRMVREHHPRELDWKEENGL